MLKIRRTIDGDRVVLELSGRIEAESLPHLETLIRGESQRIALDLKEVSLVGRDAVRFLAQWEEGGGSLTHCPAYVREWICQERHGN